MEEDPINQADQPAQSATTRTFHLPELLEQILTNLPQRDLLLAQRVSKAFHLTICASPKLQRALFFAPDPLLPASPITYLNPKTGATSAQTKPQNNRLLLRAFPGVYPTVSPVLFNLPPSREDLLVGRPGREVWSWDLCISFPAGSSTGNGNGKTAPTGSSGEGRREAGGDDQQSPLPAASTNPASSHPRASWRRMYLSQPPCTALHLVRRWRRSREPAIERAGGITMGDFVDEATKGSGAWSDGFVSSDSDWHFEGVIGERGGAGGGGGEGEAAD